MDYQETCEYLFNQIPMFERQGTLGYKEGLSNTLLLDEHLRHPHQTFSTIHIGGTNGKGSVSHTLAAILQEAGYRVGLYTSPHLVDFRERIRVNGKPISKKYVVDFIEKERSFFEPLSPSFFEITTALAFNYFRDENIEIAVVEVGLGGRLDCTNIITPIVSIITNISFDHTQFLGNTLAKIATEKAGIIKKGIPVVIGESNNETRPVFETKAIEVGAPIVFAEDDPEVKTASITSDGGMQYETQHWGKLCGDLGGIYQQKNLNTVLCALDILKSKGFFENSTVEVSQHTKNTDNAKGILQKALRHVVRNTGLMGRWQIVKKQPLVVCDTGHNVGGWQYISKQLRMIQCCQMHIVFGMVSDKDIEGVLELLPKQAKYYFTKADTPRAIDQHKIQIMAAKHGLEGETYETVKKAYQAAINTSRTDDFIFIGGSSYVVGEYLETCI